MLLIVVAAPIAIPLLIFWLIIYSISYGIARARLDSWLNRCLAEYRESNLAAQKPQHDHESPLHATVQQPRPTRILDPGIFRVIDCVGCHQKLRVPAFAGRVKVRCPSCNMKWEIET